MHTHRHHQRSQSDRGGWQDHARGSSGAGVGAPSPGRFGPGHRHGPDPVAGGGQVQPEVPALLDLLEPLDLDGAVARHRRRDAHPDRHSPVDHPARWSLLPDRQGQLEESAPYS